MDENKNSKKIILAVGAVIALILFAYLSGIIIQKLDPVAAGIKGQQYDWAGNPIGTVSLVFNPITCIYLGFTAGLKILLLLSTLLIGVSIFIYFNKESETNRDERNFKTSSEGTYGTSGWMNMTELKAILDYKPIGETTGTILGMRNGKICSLPVTSGLNKHTAIYGASGTGKSRCFVRPQILQCVARGESIIITDPKGEIYADTAEFMRQRGYDVKMFNLVDPQYSDSWNCLSEITINQDQIELMAQTFATVIISNTSGEKGDHFWDNAEMNLLKALSLFVCLDDTRNETARNIGAVYELLTNNDEKKLNAMFDKLPIGHPAKQPWSIFKQAGDNVRGNVIIGLGARLQVFQSEIIKRITTYKEIDLEGPAKQKSALFVIMSDQDSTLDFLSSLMFSFLFIRLVRYADVKGKDGKCDVPVNFILDEFPNIGSIPDFTKKLSTIRSRDLRVAVIFQNIAQLQNRYPDGLWEEIVGNCDTQLFLGCTDQMTAKFISERTGEMTIEVNSTAAQRSSISIADSIPSYRDTKSVGKRYVLTPDEVMRLPNSNCLVIMRGQKVLKLDKFDYSKHPGAKNFVHSYVRDYVPAWKASQNSRSFSVDDSIADEKLDLTKDNIQSSQDKLYEDPDDKNKKPPFSGGTGAPSGGSAGRPARQKRPVSKVKLSQQQEQEQFDGIITQSEQVVQDITPTPIVNSNVEAKQRTRQVATDFLNSYNNATESVKPQQDTYVPKKEIPAPHPVEAVQKPKTHTASSLIDMYENPEPISETESAALNLLNQFNPGAVVSSNTISAPPKQKPKSQPDENLEPVTIGIDGRPIRKIVPKPTAQMKNSVPDDF